jgi:hypothetical protein
MGMTDSRVGGELSMTGRSSYLAAFAVGFAIFSLAVCIFVGVTKSDLNTLLTPPIIAGITCGWGIAAGALSKVVVSPDRVELTNMFRLVTIKREAIAGLQTQGGIYIILRNGKWIVPTAYAPALGKRLFTSNRRAASFGAKMASILGVDADVPDPQPQQISPGMVTARLRLATPMYMVAGAAICAGIAVVLRVLT